MANSGATHLEFIGVDGNHCVNASVLVAVERGYRVSVDLACLGVTKEKKFQKTLKNWKNNAVIVKEKNDR